MPATLRAEYSGGLRIDRVARRGPHRCAVMVSSAMTSLTSRPRGLSRRFDRVTMPFGGHL